MIHKKEVDMKGGLRKIKDFKREVCTDPRHKPPGHMVYKPGLYEYTCPRCGHVTPFQVPLITC